MPSVDGGPPSASAFWTANWTDADGNRQTRKFSVNYWDEERARQKAMQVRVRQLLQAQGEAPRGTPNAQKKSMPPREAVEDEIDEIDEMRNISRVNGMGVRSDGWEVKIRRAKVRKSRHFTDSVHGGEASALAAAKAWRAQMLQQMDGLDYQVWKRKQRMATNTSGTPGIYRGVAGSTKGGKYVETPYWQGYWTDLDGKRRSRVFSIHAYGEEGARALALQFRREGVAEAARGAALRQASLWPSEAAPVPKPRRRTSPAP